MFQWASHFKKFLHWSKTHPFLNPSVRYPLLQDLSNSTEINVLPGNDNSSRFSIKISIFLWIQLCTTYHLEFITPEKVSERFSSKWTFRGDTYPLHMTGTPCTIKNPFSNFPIKYVHTPYTIKRSMRIPLRVQHERIGTYLFQVDVLMRSEHFYDS